MTIEYSIVLIVFLFLLFTFLSFTFRLYNYVILEVNKEEIVKTQGCQDCPLYGYIRRGHKDCL